eukprot:gene995-590_t
MEHMMNQSGGRNSGGGGGGGGGGQQPARRVNPIRPVTIKQILQANTDVGSVLVVDGRELTQATVVGRVTEYESAHTGVSNALMAKHFGYVVTDNTGMMVVRKWVEAESAEELIPIGSHVRAAGTIKVWQGTPVVTGTVMPIADSNELNYHFLDAILTHLRLTQGNRRPSGAGAAGGAVKNTAAAVGAMNMLPGGNEQVPVTDLIVSIIRQRGSGETGLSMDEIITNLRAYNCGLPEARDALRILTSEGKIYETHDGRFNI